jgi:hypothetical protein
MNVNLIVLFTEEIDAAKTATQAEQKMSMKEREGLQKAEEHRNKLLEYERDKVRRTIIYGMLSGELFLPYKEIFNDTLFLRRSKRLLQHECQVALTRRT